MNRLWGWRVRAVEVYRFPHGETRLVSSPATAADVTDQLIPAFETDLATNQVTVAPASSNDGNCTIYASDPYKESGHIKGDGSQFCSGNYHLQRIKVTIEQYRGLGIWDKKASVGYTGMDAERLSRALRLVDLRRREWKPTLSSGYRRSVYRSKRTDLLGCGPVRQLPQDDLSFITSPKSATMRAEAFGRRNEDSSLEGWTR
jgi:hypothetical protein